MKEIMGSTNGIRVLGAKNVRPKWDRFNRLQKSAQALVVRSREPAGVHCFKTWEDFNEWKMKHQLRGGFPARTTS